MTKVNRETLKSYFRSGSRPDDSQFVDLIDSVPNIIDDGIARSDKEGLKLAPTGGKGSVLEFFRDIQDDLPAWKITLDPAGGILSLVDSEDNPVVTFSPGEPVRVHAGIESYLGISAPGFSGNFRRQQVIDRPAKADGRWHTVPLIEAGEKDGCRAYRIVAGCGKGSTGKYALLEATAMHCCGKKRRIRTVSSWIGCRFHRIRLRWHTENGQTVLQIRTRRNYGDSVVIRYRVTEIWSDYNMDQNYPLPEDFGNEKGK